MDQEKTKEFIGKYNDLCKEYGICLQPSLQAVELKTGDEVHMSTESAPEATIEPVEATPAPAVEAENLPPTE